MKKVIGIDIGGTAIKYGLLDETGRILTKSECAVDKQAGGPGILKAVLGIVEEQMKAEGAETILGTAISSAGMVDVERGEIFYAGPTIPGYTGTSFKREISSRFHIPCEVENDVNCAGLAEYRSGAARGARSMVCLTIGTGIGGCAVVDGHVLHGVCGSAMEIGYMHLEGGDFQSLGSAQTLSERVAEAKYDTADKWDGRRIFAAAKEGDDVCIRMIDEMCRVLGIGLANLCYCLNPEVIVLGGGIMAQKEYLYPRIRRALDENLKPVIAQHTRLTFAAYGNSAGMMGAFYHFMSRQGYSSGL